MKTRAYNFGAGPATLPLEILEEAKEELLNWQGLGMSILEIGHRTPPFMQLMEDLTADFREILAIPNDYHVLFLNGPARSQFAMIPLNLLNNEQKAGYLISGVWSSYAYEEACKLKKAYCVASTSDLNFTEVPKPKNWDIQEDTTYLYYTPNETIDGVRFHDTPKVDNIPLIADMTSCLLSEPINIRDYGLIFAGAQKNISIAGLTIVILRNDLLEKSPDLKIPTMLDYKIQVNHKSLYATPPGFNCYLAHKMLQWIKAKGGIDSLYQMNCKKAALLYDYIDDSTFYKSEINKNSRSIVNICFTLERENLIDEFLIKANKHGLLALKGHRIKGGLRASLYNSMPIEGVLSLITFMDDFAKEQSK